MKDLELIYNLCEAWSEEYATDFNDVIYHANRLGIYEIKMNNSEVILSDVMALDKDLKANGWCIESIDADNNYISLWLIRYIELY